MAANRSTLFEHATIISYDTETDSLRILRNASFLVNDGYIVQLTEGPPSAVPDGTEVIDATGKIISPGFVNTHHHMWQSAFRTLAANTTLSEYLAGRYVQSGPAGNHFTADDVYLGQLACALEMIDGGTTTVLDHAHAVFTNDHITAAVDASFQSGLRIFYAHTIQDIRTTGYTTQMGIEKLFDLTKDSRFADITNPVELGVAYDAWAFVPAEVNMKFMETLINHNNTVAQPNAPISVITTHYVGGPYGAYNSPSLLNSFPKSAIAQSELTKPTKLPIIFSHASFMSNQDAQILRTNPHISISTTPESETHYGHSSAGAEMCQDCASLGVDTHFTFSSYMPFQARLWLQLLRDKHYRQTTVDNWGVPINNPMDCEAAFLLMTQKGGEALGRHDLGVIKVGAQADLVIFDARKSTGLWGVHDPVAAVVLHTGGAGDVESVMVQGRWLKRDGKLVSPLVGGGGVTVDEVRDRFVKSASRIQKIWEEEVGPISFKEGDKWMSGAKYGRCRTIDVRRKIAGSA